MNRGYVLDRAGVEAINRAISRVGNTPPAMLETNRRHRITVTEGGGAYLGYFMVIDASEGDAFKVKVIDGKDPDGEYCGYTDIVGKVPVAILDNPAGKLIILSAEYDTEAQNYKLEIVAKTEAEVSGLCYFLLAEVKSDRSILQRWEAGTINFGERYVI